MNKIYIPVEHIDACEDGADCDIWHNEDKEEECSHMIDFAHPNDHPAFSDPACTKRFAMIIILSNVAENKVKDTEKLMRDVNLDAGKELAKDHKRIPPCCYGISCKKKNDREHNKRFWHSTYRPPCQYKQFCKKRNDKMHMERFWHSTYKPPCRYAAKCHRKDAQHLNEFWHPRPPCRFGEGCYNTNAEHTKQFYHPVT